MKHKILTFALALLTAASAWAYDFKVNGLCYNILSSTEVEVTYEQFPSWLDEAYLSLSGSVNVPSTVTNNGTVYNVIRIGGSAFANCSSITSITISEGIIDILFNAFSSCTSLTSAYIANSVRTIDYMAFSNCTALTSLTMGVTDRMGEWVFSDCSALQSVHYTGTLADWCGITFAYETSNPLYYAHNLYINNQLVTELVIPEGATNINDYAFIGCDNITSIAIPSTVTSIGYYAFNFGESQPLTTLTLLSANPPTISENTFSNICHSTTITVPKGSKEAYLADPNWKYLFDLTSDEISGTIGYEQNLTWTLVFADSTLTISGTGEMGYINEYESWQPFSSSVAKVVIEEGVINIAYNAFRYHENLREITIPNSVTSIASDAFYETALYYNESNWADGALYIDNCLIATSEWQMGETGHFTVADETRVIADEAFRYKSWLTDVTLPNSVTNIGERAFYN